MENLGIDSTLILAQGINFALFFIVFKKFLAAPFLRFIASEKKKDQERERMVAQAQILQEKAEKAQSEAREKAKKELSTLMAEAKKEAEATKQELIGQAHAEVESMKASAQAQLEHEREQLEKLAKEQITHMSFVIVEKSLGDVLTPDMKKKVTEAILKNAPQKVTLYEN